MGANAPHAGAEALGACLTLLVVIVPTSGHVQQGIRQQHVDQLPWLVQGDVAQYRHDGV